MREPRDGQILDLLRHGRTEQAFEMLLYAYQHKVYRLALGLTADHQMAEDAAQETFLRVWRYLGRFRGDSELGTWIYSIARNRCITLLQRKNARREVLADTAPEPVARSGPPEPATDLVAALGQLEDRHREAVTLYYFHEQSYEEVSRHMGVPLGTVKTYLHRARKVLSEWFARQGQGRGRL